MDKTRNIKVQLVFVPPVEMPKLGELGEGISPPLGLLYIAAYLESRLKNLELAVTDGLLKGYKQTLAKIDDFDPDILCVSYYTPTAQSACKLVTDLKEKKPELFIIAGGPHVSALPEEIMEKSRADAAVIGEGEQTVLELVNEFRAKKNVSLMDFGSVDGIAFRKDGEVIRTSPREFIKDINTIPFPARDLVDMKDYRGWYLCKQTPETTVILSRGCPYNCTFCSNVVWKSSRPYVRLRSPKNVADEIESLSEKYGIREVFDNSDEFNGSVQNAIAICDEIKKRRLDISWKTQLRAHPLPEELVRAMAGAGCWYVHLGIESGNPRTLKGIKKHITLEQVKEACLMLKKYKIKILGLFMLFNVWEEGGELLFEDVESTQNTLSFAEMLANGGLLDYLGWSITTPYPGSALYDTAFRFNLIKEELSGNWDSWLKDDSFVMQLPGVDEREQARLKTVGSMLRAKCMLRSRNFGLKDLGFIAKKAVKLVQNEVLASIHGRRSP